MDRLLGVIGILLAAAAGLILAPDLLGERAVRLALIVAVGGSAVATAVVFSGRVAAAAAGMARALPRSARLHHGLDRLVTALQAYRGRHGMLAAVLAASVAVQFIRIVQAWLLGLALGIAAGFTAYLAFIPIILLVLLLPLPGNGIGSGNLAFIWLFTRIGVTRADAFALGVLFIGLGIVGNVPGALLYAFGRGERPTEARA
jgi:hypothetical protein